jgi:DNA-binding response OmpR family regulator
MKLLLVEDSAHLRQCMARGLEHLGFVVAQAEDGPGGLWAARESAADVLILDVSLPGFSGVELLKRLRGEGVRTPALFLTSMADLDDRLSGFDAGADDYVLKPVDVRELAARVTALMRRAAGNHDSVLSCADIEVDLSRAQVRLQGRPIELCRRERLLLELLVVNRGRVVSRRQIESKLYNDETELSSNSVEAAVSRLRRAIDIAGQPSRIKTLRGEGYRLEG